MSSRTASLVLGFVMGFAAASPALAQSSTNGAGGGYVGSDAWFKSQRDSAIQRGNIERNLGGGKNAAEGTGRDIELRIAFPKAQRGLRNITHVVLVPDKSGAREVAGLASFDRETNALKTAFAPRKDVQAATTYAVFVTDARGGTYGPLGRIQVGDAPRQTFQIDAPMIGQNESAPPSRRAGGSPPR